MKKRNGISVGFSLVLSALLLSDMDIFHPQSLMLALKLFLALTLFGIAFLEVVARTKVHSLRRQGLYPPANHATLADVEALLRADERIKAIQLYRKIYRVSLQDALRAIDQIQPRPTNAN